MSRPTAAGGGLKVPALIVLFLLGLPGPVHAQLFFATRPSPELALGPLFIRAMVTPGARDVPVDVLFGLVIPPRRSALEFEQDLYLLWPGEVATALRDPGPRDPALTRAVTAQGLEIVAGGRLPLFVQRHYEVVTDTEPVPGDAPYVTFVGIGGPLGLTAPATYIRIPWNPKLANRAWLMDLRLTARNLIRPRPATWFARTLWGTRYGLAVGFNDVGPPAMFAMYFSQRDRVLPVADPGRLIVNFAGADTLGIDEIDPRSSRRGLSQSLDKTEEVSLFLTSDGLTPQVLSIQFGYFSRLQSWGPVLIPALFFALGNGAGVLARNLTERLSRRLAGRVQLRRRRGPFARQSGVVIARETLARIIPGETTLEEVLHLCGPAAEEHEGLTAPDRRLLVYLGHREVPERRWTWGWLATVGRWDVEDHKVEIVLERGVVRDVQAHLRRTRLPPPG
jgi:hypothetical protein